jgi:hypothetical protein
MKLIPGKGILGIIMIKGSILQENRITLTVDNNRALK